MAVPVVVSTILRNIKVIGTALLIGGAITFGVGLYYHGKKVQSLESQIELLQSQAETERIVREIVDSAAEQNIERRREISQARSESTQERQEVKRQDEDSADYLDAPIPERVQLIRERARCISLPYTCKPSSGE